MTLPCWSSLAATLLSLPQMLDPVIGRDREIACHAGSARRQKNKLRLFWEILVLARLPLLRVWLSSLLLATFLIFSSRKAGFGR